MNLDEAVYMSNEYSFIAAEGYETYLDKKYPNTIFIRPKWINVKDRLPPLDRHGPYSVHVLACRESEIGIAYICWDDHIFDDDGNIDISCDLKTAMSHGWGYWDWCDGSLEGEPTNWMPLPRIVKSLFNESCEREAEK